MGFSSEFLDASDSFNEKESTSKYSNSIPLSTVFRVSDLGGGLGGKAFAWERSNTDTKKRICAFLSLFVL